VELLLAFPGERLFRECSLRFSVDGCRAQLRRGLALRDDLSVDQDLYPQFFPARLGFAEGGVQYAVFGLDGSYLVVCGQSGMVRWGYEIRVTNGSRRPRAAQDTPSGSHRPVAGVPAHRKIHRP
jgi:hypothetical protein